MEGFVVNAVRGPWIVVEAETLTFFWLSRGSLRKTRHEGMVWRARPVSPVNDQRLDRSSVLHWQIGSQDRPSPEHLKSVSTYGQVFPESL